MLQRRAQYLLCHGHPAVANRLDDAQFMFAKVGEDRLIPVTAAAASGEPMHALGKAKNLPVLMYGEASGIGQIMRSVMRAELEAGHFTTVFTAHHAVLLKTMALEGRGIAWLPQSLIVNELEARRLVPAGDARWTVPIDVRLFRPRAELTDVAEGLWRVVTEPAKTAP